MFKIWNVNEVMRKMSSLQLSEWMAFFMLEKEEQDKADLQRRAVQGAQQMASKGPAAPRKRTR